MSDLLLFSAVEARQALDKGDVSATELTSAYLDAVEATSALNNYCLLYTSPSPRDEVLSRMPSSA